MAILPRSSCEGKEHKGTKIKGKSLLEKDINTLMFWDNENISSDSKGNAIAKTLRTYLFQTQMFLPFTLRLKNITHFTAKARRLSEVCF